MKLLPIFAFVLVFGLQTFLSPTAVLAGTFQLKNIGALSTNGSTGSHWWYTSPNPRLSGSALTSTDVVITVDGKANTVTSASDGSWVYTPQAGDGDHEVKITSSGSTIAFTLTIGKDVPTGVGAPPAPNTPVAGSIYPLLGLMAAGGMLFTFGLKLKRA